MPLVAHFDGNVTGWSWTSPDRNTTKTTGVDATNFTIPFVDLKCGLKPQFEPAHPVVFLVLSRQPIACAKVEKF